MSLIGARVGNYVATKKLGAGGMGAVYLAEHPEIGRQVAIKVLDERLSLDEQFTQRFLAEAKAVAQIDHENVIGIYDFGHLPDGCLYYVMEALKGQELRAVIDQHKALTPEKVLPYLEQICSGLQAAHREGIVHRDLKPENIFVLDKQPMRLKILDFGIAKQLAVPQGAGLTSTGMIMGTPIYMAPEQALGHIDQICPQTDIYALGVILYLMLAGRPPFSGPSVLLLAKHAEVQPPPLAETAPRVPRAVAEIVEACLAKSPQARPVSVAMLLERFRAAIIPTARSAGPVAPPDQSQGSPPGTLAAGEWPGLTAAPAVTGTGETVRPGAPCPGSPAPGAHSVIGPAAPSEPAETTLGGAAAQLTEPLAVPKSWGMRSLPIAVVALAVLGSVVFLLLRSGDQDVRGPAAATGAVGGDDSAGKTKPPTPSKPPESQTPVHTLVPLRLDVEAGARCRITVDGTVHDRVPRQLSLGAKKTVRLDLLCRGYELLSVEVKRGTKIVTLAPRKRTARRSPAKKAPKKAPVKKTAVRKASQARKPNAKIDPPKPPTKKVKPTRKRAADPLDRW